jgi:hypothetical protein
MIMISGNSMLIRDAILSGALAVGLAVSPLHAGKSASSRQKQTAKVERIPDRLLTCSIRHVINFDPEKQQTASELNYDSVHRLTLFLPSIPVRTKGPPEPYEKPEPVDPRTKIMEDPDHIAPQQRGRFERIIDYWPERTELSASISGELINAIVINRYDPVNKTANLFMTRATELTHFQPEHIYQGQCQVRIGSSATKPPTV